MLFMKATPFHRIRTARGKTLEEIARAVNSNPGNLSRIGRGVNVPSLRLAEALARYFDGEVSELELLYPERFMANEAQGNG